MEATKMTRNERVRNWCLGISIGFIGYDVFTLHYIKGIVPLALLLAVAIIQYRIYSKES